MAIYHFWSVKAALTLVGSISWVAVRYVLGLKIPTLALIIIGWVGTIGKDGWGEATDEFWIDVWEWAFEESGERGVFICSKEREFGVGGTAGTDDDVGDCYVELLS